MARFFLDNPTEFLNLILCGVVCLLNLWYRQSHSRECDARYEQEHKKQIGTEFEEALRKRNQRWWRVYSSAFGWWTASWGAWTLLYAIKLLFAYLGPDVPVLLQSLLHVISDANSLCLFMVFYTLTRGHSVTSSQCTNLAATLFAGLVITDAILLGFGLLLSEAESPSLFLKPWSTALAMFSMFVFGRAFMLRFQTYSIWVLATCYCLCQLFAYDAAFTPARQRSARVPVPRRVEIPTDLKDFISVGQDRDQKLEYTVHLYENGGKQQEARKMTSRQTLQVLWALKDAESVTLAGAYFILRFRECLFLSLALMKLALAGAVVAKFSLKPTEFGCLIVQCERPSENAKIVQHHPFYRIVTYYGLLAILIYGVVVIGPDVAVALCPAGYIVGRMLWKVRKGEPPLAVLDGAKDT